MAKAPAKQASKASKKEVASDDADKIMGIINGARKSVLEDNEYILLPKKDVNAIKEFLQSL
tara:strand:- start:156 stop:338 length:183 start_codon:yes stop_codon:yes gene_type:complete